MSEQPANTDSEERRKAAYLAGDRIRKQGARLAARVMKHLQVTEAVPVLLYAAAVGMRGLPAEAGLSHFLKMAEASFQVARTESQTPPVGS